MILSNKMKQKLFWPIWGVGALAACWIFYGWQVSGDLVSVVENKTHVLSMQEDGVLSRLLVNVGYRVEVGQILATLDNSTLNAQKRMLKAQLAELDSVVQYDRQRFVLEYRWMGLRLENEAMDLSLRTSEIEAKKAELNVLDAELDRLQKAEEAGLGRSPEFSETLRRHDMAKAFLLEQKSELAKQKRNLKRTNQARSDLKTTTDETMVESMLADRKERIEELRRLLKETEGRIRMGSIQAPCTGYVTQVRAHSGDTIAAFSPLITIEEEKAKNLIAYLPDEANLDINVGDRMELLSSRSDKFNTVGTVSFIFPGFSPIPERLAFRGQIFWTQKVLIKIAADHQLLPGEVVRAKLTGSGNQYVAVAEAQVEGQPANVEPMTIPPELHARSRFEPSGVIWLGDLGEYLIVSDDTGLPEHVSDHAPWLFFMKPDGRVLPETAVIGGLDKVNDLEAIASFGDFLYLVSSQNISKNGKRPLSRQYLYKVKRNGRQFELVSRRALLEMILKSYAQPKLQKLGLTGVEADGLPTLNIEGAAFHDGKLYLGLKSPHMQAKAIIWRLENPQSMFHQEILAPDQLKVFATLDIEPRPHVQAGISDLAFDKNGKMWLLSTVPDADSDAQVGGLYRVDEFAQGSPQVRLWREFPRMKPEGLCFDDEDRMVVVFDSDNRSGSFASLGEAE